MKKTILFIVIAICSMVYTYGQEQLKINTETSKIKWSCDYSFHFGGHYGLVAFKTGHFIKTKGKITGGTFVINLNSITNTDIETAQANESLVEHIKNEDFFDVAKYPTATLVITDTHYYDATHVKITANLTIKNVTQSISFQAEMDFDKKSMTTRFKIDRTLWGINYKSKSIMGALKNDAISDAIGFEVVLSL